MTVPRSARYARALRAAAVRGVGGLVLAMCGPASVTDVGGGRVCLWPVDRAGRAIGPCMFVGVNEYLGTGAATATGAGVGAVTVVSGFGGDAERCKKAGRREVGDAAREMVILPPSLLEI